MNKHTLQEKAIAVLLIIIPLFLILYWLHLDKTLPPDALTLSEWTTLLGAVLTYCGTAFLGWMTYRVNRRLVSIEERNQEVSELNLLQENVPILDVDLLSVIQKPLQGKSFDPVESSRDTLNGLITRRSVQVFKQGTTSLDITVAIKNMSNYGALNFQWETGDNLSPNNCGTVAEGNDAILQFNVPMDKQSSDDMAISTPREVGVIIRYDNMYGHHYRQTAGLVVFRFSDSILVSFSLAEPEGTIHS